MQVPLSVQFLVPMLLQLLGILLISIYYGLFRRTKTETRKAGIYRCSKCKHVYVDIRQVPATSCPRCRTLNDVIPR